MNWEPDKFRGLCALLLRIGSTWIREESSLRGLSNSSVYSIAETVLFLDGVLIGCDSLLPKSADSAG